MRTTTNSEKEQLSWRYWTGFMGLFTIAMLITTNIGLFAWPGEPLQRRYLGIGVIVASLVAAASMALALRSLRQRPGAFVQGILGGTLLRLFVGVLGCGGAMWLLIRTFGKRM